MHNGRKDSNNLPNTKKPTNTKRGSKVVQTQKTYLRKKTKDAKNITQSGGTNKKKIPEPKTQTSNKDVSQVYSSSSINYNNQNNSGQKINNSKIKNLEPNSEKKSTIKDNEKVKSIENRNIQNKDIGQNKNKIVIENNKSESTKYEIKNNYN